MTVVPAEEAAGIRATVEIRIQPADLQHAPQEEKITDVFGDVLMEALLARGDLLDPMVSTDLANHAVDVSFEFDDAAGNVADDSSRALKILLSALDAVGTRLDSLLGSEALGVTGFDWRTWWNAETKKGSVQYPLVGIGG